MSVKRIIFTGNILRIGSDKNNKKTNQTLNIKWLHGLLAGTVSNVTGLNCEVVTWDRGTTFDSSFIYKSQGLPVNLESFGYMYNSRKIHGDVLSYFNFNFRNSLVIGFEMPPIMLKILDKLGIPYIDFMIHPARFMNDMVLGIRTNIESSYKEINTFRLSEERILIEAGLRKARLVKSKEIGLDANTAMFAGQVDFDTSLISDDGSFISIFDYESELKDLVNSYGNVLYKPHPYNKSKEANDMFMDLGFSKDSNNFYELISQEDLSAVYALTSSVVYEASYFGKKSKWFCEYPFDFGVKDNSFSKFRFVPVIGSFLDPNFWVRILGEAMDIPVKRKTYAVSTDMLHGEVRKSLNVNWGYEVFE